MPGLFQIIFIN